MLRTNTSGHVAANVRISVDLAEQVRKAAKRWGLSVSTFHRLALFHLLTCQEVDEAQNTRGAASLRDWLALLEARRVIQTGKP